MRMAKRPPPFDRRRLTNDPHLRQEVSTVVRDHLGVVPPSGSSVDDVEISFRTAILQTAERVVPPRAGRLQRRGWTGDAEAETYTNMAMTAKRAAWKRQKAKTQGSQLKRAVRRKNMRVHGVRGAA